MITAPELDPAIKLASEDESSIWTTGKALSCLEFFPETLLRGRF